MVTSLDAEKEFHLNSIPHHVISLGENRDTKNIPNYNKGNIQQANSQHLSK